MSEFILAHGSYFAIIAVLILTGTGLPIPEEVPIIAAGVLSANGQLLWWLALPSCLLGALLGDCVMYWIGYHFGRSVLREHPYWSHFVKPEREAQIEQMLHVHGLKVFFLARFLVGLRSPVYLSAGIMRVPFRRFFLIDLFCATAVISVFFGISYYFGETIATWIKSAEIVLTVVVVLALVGVGVYFWRRHRRHQATIEAKKSETTEQTSNAPEKTPEEAEETAA
jgi:membrane protein DedA with SNARE-associated domain